MTQTRQARRQRSAMLLTVALSACAGAAPARPPLSPPPPQRPCLAESVVTLLRTRWETTIDAATRAMGLTSGESRLVEDKCWKRTYERRGMSYIVFQNPDDPKAPIQLSSIERNSDNAACRARAMAELDALHLPSVNSTILQHRRRFAWQWANPEVGPGNWLECRPDAPPQEFLESLGVMVHEMVHNLRRGQCLFESPSGTARCFQLGDELPHRSLARLDTFPTTNPQQAQALAAIQTVYLTANDEPPLILFDELNAYILTTEVWTAQLEAKGVDALFNGENREAALLTLFADYVVLYAERLRAQKPVLFAKALGPGSVNRAELVRLLDRGAAAQAAWVAALARVQKAPKQVEANLWSDFTERREKLGL